MTHLSLKLNLPSTVAHCPMSDGCLDFKLLLCLAEELLLLRQCRLFIMISPFPQPRTLLACLTTHLSLSFMTSSSPAHGPISLFRPFILTIAPQNSTLSFLEKSGISISGNHISHACIISSRVGVFSPTNERAPNTSTSGTP